MGLVPPQSIKGLFVRPLLPRVAALLAVPALFLAGCASEGTPAGTVSSSAAPGAAEASTALSSVKVTGEAGKKPTVTLASAPLTLTASGVKVLTQGNGAVIAKGQRVTVDYVLLNGKTGKEADTTFGKTTATFLADPGQLLPGLANGLIGQKIGSRVLVGVAPKDGFAGGAGNSQLKFGKDDALVFVIDIKSAVTPLSGPEGDPVSPAAGLPTVKPDAKGVPVITMPKTPPSKTLVVQPLIKGKGAVVKSGQTISAAYVGAVYATGKIFDSSFVSGNKLEVPIGVGGLVPGFDKGVVGQTVGSRVLLVLPPDQGYGTAGNAQAKIKGTDTIVFVVDILSAS